MRFKHKLFVLSLLTLMVFSSLFAMSGSYAFWRGDVIGSSDTAIASVMTGEWDQVFEWDPNATYLDGDVVENNGVLYEAKRDNPDREPGVAKGWNRDWFQL
ncbi:MAG: carbohydrate-binding protein [Candidatus Izemoplasmataceae bacterium]